MHSIRQAGGGYVDKPTSRAVASVYMQTDVVQPVQIAGRGKPVPEMLCGTADVVDPELTQPGFTPPEESGPLPVLQRVCRAEVRCRRVLPVWKSSFSPRHSGYIESQTCRVVERERTAEGQVQCQYRAATAYQRSNQRSRSTCRTWSRCQSRYEEAVRNLPYPVRGRA